MTDRANWFWQIRGTTATSWPIGSKAVVESPLYQAGVQPGIRERLIGMFIKNAISLKIYFSNSKIIAVSLPGMKRRLSIFMPLFHLPVFWFGYFDGFKTLSRFHENYFCRLHRSLKGTYAGKAYHHADRTWKAAQTTGLYVFELLADTSQGLFQYYAQIWDANTFKTRIFSGSNINLLPA